MRRLSAALLATALASAGTAGGLRDLEDAWLVPASAVRALVEADSTRHAGWSVALVQGRLFGVDDLPQLGVAIGRRWPGAACRIRWERLGRDLYREDQGRLELLVGGGWRLGAEVGVDRLALAGDDARLAAAADLRLACEFGRRLHLDVWWPLAEAPSWYGQQGLRRWLRLRGGGEGWVWAVVADRRASGAPVLQGEVMLRLAPAAALGLRFEPWSGAAGLCTAWRLGGLVLRSSHLVHPDLGPTHRWGLDVGAWP